MHLGHAFAAITAREAGERFLLRIEDLDTLRCREEFVDAILEDLAWLGLTWEPVMRQSERTSAYRAALEKLDNAGLVFPCFCTRKEIVAEIAQAVGAPSGPDGPTYPGTCRHLLPQQRSERVAKGLPHALRLDATKAAAMVGPLEFQEQGLGPRGEHGRIAVQPLLFGDIVLARKDVPAAYHLAVVVDDAHQGVTLVTRGNDLFAASHVQRLLQALLGLSAPSYAHHRLILDAAGRKFSKRDQSLTLRTLRESGETPDGIRARLSLPERRQ